MTNKILTGRACKITVGVRTLETSMNTMYVPEDRATVLANRRKSGTVAGAAIAVAGAVDRAIADLLLWLQRAMSSLCPQDKELTTVNERKKTKNKEKCEGEGGADLGKMQALKCRRGGMQTLRHSTAPLSMRVLVEKSARYGKPVALGVSISHGFPPRRFTLFGPVRSGLRH